MTALTAQNSVGVRHVLPASMESLQAQLDALSDDLPAAAVKIGMLGSAEAVSLIAAHLEEMRNVPLVLDPVIVTTSGVRISDDATLEALKTRLAPLATLSEAPLDSP